MRVWRICLNPARFNCENEKYSASIIYDSAITCDEIIKSSDEEIITILTNFNEKMRPAKRKNSIFYLHLFQLLYHYW